MAVDIQDQDQSIAVGVFESMDKAEAAITELRAAGFPPAAIGIGGRDLGRDPERSTRNQSEKTIQTEESAVAGAVTGAGMGALWGLGIATGVLPAVGPVLAGGILASLLAGTATGATAGGLLGALIGLGLSESEARTYETAFSRGGIIVTVRAADRWDEATSILEAHGASGTRSRPIAPRPLESNEALT